MLSAEYKKVSELLDIQLSLGSTKISLDIDEGFFGLLSEKSTEMHNHSSYEIHLITGGQGILHGQNSDMEIHSNYLCIIPPGLYHAISSDAKNPLTKYQLRFHLEPKKDNFTPETSECDELFIQKAFSSMNNLIITQTPQTVPNFISLIHEEIDKYQACYSLNSNFPHD